MNTKTKTMIQLGGFKLTLYSGDTYCGTSMPVTEAIDRGMIWLNADVECDCGKVTEVVETGRLKNCVCGKSFLD